MGLPFRNTVGLGAGFDKNAKYLRELEALGFGFVEIGTVTPRPQAGNDKPRLFRLPKDKALINRMGFNNDGVEVITERMKIWRQKQWALADKQYVKVQLEPKPGEGRQRGALLSSPHPEPLNYQPPITFSRIIVGGNIGKNKNTPNEEAWKDYETCFLALHPYVDFFVVNVSSPNTPGLRELQEKESLKKILVHLQTLNAGMQKQKPILLKIAPDLSWSQIDDVIDLSGEIGLDGLVASNTTISREGLVTESEIVNTIGAGGLSGEPLQERSTEIVKYIRQKTNITLIASGGISDEESAKEKFQNGANLIEVWTGFIYEGPKIVKRICKALEK